MFFLPKYNIEFYLKSFKIKLKDNLLYFKLNTKNPTPKKGLLFNLFLVKDNYLLPFHNKRSLKFNKIFKSDFKNWLSGNVYGFKRRILVKGMGFNFSLVNGILIIKLVLSHNCIFKVPDSIRVYIKSPQVLELFSFDLGEINKLSYKLIKLLKFNLYTLKGIYIYKTALKKKISAQLSN